MSTTIVNGIKLHYWQTGEGPDLVMLHGLMGNLAVWHLRIVPLLQHAFRVTTYDLRGHGYSDAPPTGYTTLDMVGDLETLLDTLGIEKALLVGHSFGADIALHFALLHPERVQRLALLEAGLAALIDQRKRADWEGWAFWVRKLAEVGVEVPPEKRSDFQYLLNVSLDTPKFYGPAKSLPRKRGPLLHLLNNTTLVQDYEAVMGLTPERIAAVATPTLVVYGEHTYFMGSFHFLANTLPNCRTVLLAGGEHFGPLEQPDLLASHLHDFFQPAEQELRTSYTIGLREAV